MSNSERLVEFELLGQEYRFYTAATEEEMQAILSLVRQLIETEPNANIGTLATGKKAILACLNIASRYVKLQQDFTDYQESTEKRITMLSDDIKGLLSVD
ncbi:MAG: cell division protein ZapA [Desulfotalea sp.]|nr:MAG: cell division protein ZapA [Desulfotalea sp.]